MLDYNGINQTILSFTAGSGCEEGKLCRLSGSAMVKGCSEGEAFHGLVQRIYPGNLSGVVLRGVVRVSYSGTAPAVGWTKLAADGNGGVKADSESGREYLVLKVDKSAGTTEIYL